MAGDGKLGSMHFESRGPVERIRPPQKRGLRVEDIAARNKGNHIMSFGFPGSGKTTFQWFLMMYLIHEGAFQTTVRVPETLNGEDWDGRRTINDWTSLWIEGRFPEPTQASESDIREITAHVVPTEGKRIDLEFSFLEVSGELLKLAIPEADRRPQITPLIHEHFKNCLEKPHCKIVLMLLLHPDVEENDRLFASFIAYLDKKFPGLREHMSLGVIISKPETSLARLRKFGSSDGRFNYDHFDGEALEDYLNRFCGETYTIWRDWPVQDATLLAPLHLGEIS